MIRNHMKEIWDEHLKGLEEEIGMPYLFTIDCLFIFCLEGRAWQDLSNDRSVDRSKSITIHGGHCSLDSNEGNTDSGRAAI